MAGGFTGGEYYDTSRGMRGGGAISSRIEYTSHENVFGATVDDGKAEAFRKVQAGLNPESLKKKAAAWDIVQTEHRQAAGDLAAIRDEVFAAWSGDDADQARKTFDQTVTSAHAMSTYATSMHESTSHLATAVETAKGVSADGPGFGSKLAGGLGFGGGDGDGDADFAAYFKLCQDVSDGRDKMPTQVEWQNKTDGGNNQQGGYNPKPTSSRNGVGGVTATGASGTPQHTSTRTPGMTKGPDIKHPNTDGPSHPIRENPDPQATDPTSQWTQDGTGTGTDSAGNGTSGLGSDSYAGAGSPGLDTGSSLAGFDPSGGAGGGGLGGGLGAGGGLSGAGGLGSGAGGDLAAAGGGGLGGGGLGGGGLAGGGLAGGGLAGGGLAGGRAGGAGSGAAGSGAAGSGAAGRGGVAGQVAPMRGGGGAGGDEGERERSTWLQEDDDVWGESDAPPSVIS